MHQKILSSSLNARVILVGVVVAEPKLIVLIPGRIGHRWQQKYKSDETQNVQNQENTALWLGLSNEIWYICNGEEMFVSLFSEMCGFYRLPGNPIWLQNA
jgi:hypothetical protein